MKLTEVVSIWDKLPCIDECDEGAFTFADLVEAINDVLGVEVDIPALYDSDGNS